MIKTLGEQNIPNLPWEDKPKNCPGPIWRYSGNPVINRHPVDKIARIFNSGVIYKDGKYIGVFRAETIASLPHLRMGYSDDGINWKIDDHEINFVDEDGNPILGAAIRLRDSNQGSITDFDGKFSLTVPQGTTIDVMFVGVATQSINVKQDMSNITITLNKE